MNHRENLYKSYLQIRFGIIRTPNANIYMQLNHVVNQALDISISK